MQLPPFLKPGDRVGIAAPARWVDRGDLSLFCKMMEKHGWEVQIADVYERFGQFAGNDSARLQNLQELLDNPEIRAVFCARGGYGTARLLEGLEVLIDGEPAGQLQETGTVARTAFPIEEGEHTIVVAHPEWECQPARFTLGRGERSIVLFLALRRATDGHGGSIRQLVFML